MHGTLVSKALLPPYDWQFVQGRRVDGIIGVMYAHARTTSYENPLQITFVLDITVSVEEGANLKRIVPIAKARVF